MLYKRLIAKLDIKSEHVVKGVHMEGLRIIGSPSDMTKKYMHDHADEIIFIDTVASLYGRNQLQSIVASASELAFVPFSVGGGLRTIDDVDQQIRLGADKVAINTHAVSDPNYLKQVANKFGSQAIISSVQAKKIDNKYFVFIENGREMTEIDVFDWIKSVQDLGAGEILLTSIDQDGTRKGFDIELYEKASHIAQIPLIACGGAGSIEHIHQLFSQTDVSGVALGSILHYNLTTIQNIRDSLISHGIAVRSL